MMFATKVFFLPAVMVTGVSGWSLVNKLPDVADQWVDAGAGLAPRSGPTALITGRQGGADMGKTDAPGGTAWNDRGLAPDECDAPVLALDGGLDHTDWSLCDATFTSNLCGLGPDHGEEQSLRYYNVATAGNGQSIDLVVTTNSSYAANDITRNGLVNGDTCFGVINLLRGTTVDVLFSWYLTGTNMSVGLENFFFTVYDLDTGNKAVEVATFYQTVDNVYYVPNAELNVSGNLSSGLGLEFRATEFGVGPDNPTDPKSLTEKQKKRAVMVDFKNKTQWKVTFTVEGGGSGRNFVFAGKANLLTTTTTTMPNFQPTTTTTTACDLQSCQIFADPHVSGFDNDGNQGPKYLALFEDESEVNATTKAYMRTFDRRPVDVNAYDSGDFWLVKSEPVYIQGRFRLSGEFKPDMAAVGSVAVGGPFLSGSKLVVEALDGQVTFDGVAVPEGNWSSPAGDVIVQQIGGDVEVKLPRKVGLLCRRLDRHIDVKITMPRMPGGMDGECGNFDGVAENDEEQNVMERMGDVRVQDRFLLFDSRFESP